jgi:hypothetical protein
MDELDDVHRRVQVIYKYIPEEIVISYPIPIITPLPTYENWKNEFGTEIIRPNNYYNKICTEFIKWCKTLKIELELSMGQVVVIEELSEAQNFEKLKDEKITIGSFSIPIQLKNNPKDAFYQGVIWTLFSLVVFVVIALVIGFTTKFIN